MPIPIPIKSKAIEMTDTEIGAVCDVSSIKERLTLNCLCLASPLLLFHRHSYDPNSFAFPFSDKTDAVLFSLTWPVYRFPF
jgi:hypothetical protein